MFIYIYICMHTYPNAGVTSDADGTHCSGVCCAVPTLYRDTSPIRKYPPIGPYNRSMPRALWCS